MRGVLEWWRARRGAAPTAKLLCILGGAPRLLRRTPASPACQIAAWTTLPKLDPYWTTLHSSRAHNFNMLRVMLPRRKLKSQSNISARQLILLSRQFLEQTPSQQKLSQKVESSGRLELLIKYIYHDATWKKRVDKIELDYTVQCMHPWSPSYSVLRWSRQTSVEDVGVSYSEKPRFEVSLNFLSLSLYSLYTAEKNYSKFYWFEGGRQHFP
jgi:hypothetical protein